MIHGPDDDRLQNRILVVDVEQSLKGTPPDPVEIETLGWELSANGTERPFLNEDGVWLEVGDRVLVALTDDKDRDGLRGLQNSQGVFLLGNGRVLTTDRVDPLVRRLEGPSEAEFLTQLRSG